MFCTYPNRLVFRVAACDLTHYANRFLLYPGLLHVALILAIRSAGFAQTGASTYSSSRGFS